MAPTDRPESADRLRQLGRPAHVGAVEEPWFGAGPLVAGPVDLAAARVGRHEQRRAGLDQAGPAGAVGEGVEAAQPVQPGPNREGESPGRDDADPQPGERTRTEPDDDIGQLSGSPTGCGKDLGHPRGEVLGVASRVDRRGLGEDLRPVVDGDRDGAGRGVDGQEEHPDRVPAARLCPTGGAT